MIIDKNITVDLNRVQPLKVVRVHEGDVNSVRLVISLTKDNLDVNLSNISVKYDATVAGYLAEQDAKGSLNGSSIVIPITKNMTALGGVLLVDVKLIEGTSVLYTQTIKLLVERSVINDDTLIDISGTSIGQRFSNLDLRIDEVEKNHYTKAETDKLLSSKMKYEYHQGITLSDCDNYTDAQTLYRVYLDGTYQLLLCTSPTGGQFRFTKWGTIYYRVYDMGTSKWGDWKNLFEGIPDNTITSDMIKDFVITYDKLSEDYCRLFTNADLDKANNIYDDGIYVGTAPSSWSQKYGVHGEFFLLCVFGRQLVFFLECQGVFTRKHTHTAYVDKWSDWTDLTPVTPQKLEDTINGKLSSYYTKAESDSALSNYYKKTEVDSKLNGKYNVVYYNDATLDSCDNYTDPNTLYRLYIGGTYQLLINTTKRGGQYRFLRNGQVFHRSCNQSTNEWSDWKNILEYIPDGTITGDMIKKSTIPYDRLTDKYLRYVPNADIDDADNFTPYCIYTGTPSTSWHRQYEGTGYFILLDDKVIQYLILPESGNVYYRLPRTPSRSSWLEWADVSYATKDDLEGLRYLTLPAEETGHVGINHAWYTDEDDGYSLQGTYTLIGNMCFLNASAPLISGWQRVYYSLPVAVMASSTTLAVCGSDVFYVATGDLSNISVCEIKKINGSNMSSGTVHFTLVYRYK